MLDEPNIRNKLTDILSKRHFGFRSINTYKIESSDNNSTTYTVKFKEVVMGVSGTDVDEVTLNDETGKEIN